MEYGEYHKHLYQVLYIPCNDNVVEQYLLLSFDTFMKQLDA